MEIEEKYKLLFLDLYEKSKGLPDECWNWCKSKDTGRYGRVFINSKNTTGAHRVSWFINYGYLPDNLLVLHSCDNPSCINPNHLFLGSQKDNCVDRDRKGRGIKGRKKSPEHIAKLSKIRTGKGNPNYGKKASPEKLLKMSKSLKGRKTSEETRKKLSLAGKGKPAWNKGIAQSINTIVKLSKLKIEWVIRIKTLLKENGKVNSRKLSKEYGVDPETVRLVVIGKTWDYSLEDLIAYKLKNKI